MCKGIFRLIEKKMNDIDLMIVIIKYYYEFIFYLFLIILFFEKFL